MDLGVIELVLGLFVVIVGLAHLARRVGVAYPILVVIGGLVLGFVPGVPDIELEPDLVFLVLLPRDDAQQEEIDHLEIRAAVVAAQREAVIRLRDDGVIGDDVLRRIERDLDLEAIRSGI